MKQEIVGIYEIGWDQVELVLREDTGGEFYLIPEKGCIPRIKIGADYKEWEEIVSVLLHETFEFAFDRVRCRYENSDEVVRDHSSYLFVLPHVTFSETCARVGEFISKALPDLKEKWEKWKEESKPNA
jgi:hypothetical protein